jgi:Leucine-rich repeat (LRR) protein
MNSSLVVRLGVVVCTIGLLCFPGCSGPTGDSGRVQKGDPDAGKTAAPPAAAGRVSSAAAEDVEAAKKLLDGMGAVAEYKMVPDGVITEIVIREGSNLSADDIALFGKLADLESLQILNCRDLNDEMAASLAGLKNLSKLAITNSVVTDATVELIAGSFPKLKDLDLSSNTLITNSAMRTIAGLSGLERLTLVQMNFNDLGTSHLSKLQNLRALDLRGNMEAGDMTMQAVGALPKLSALRHRTTTVSDSGMEYLAQSTTLDSLLVQDFMITSQAGEHIAKLSNLTQLEIFRCQGFGSDGVLALAGMKLNRLTLRDLPMIDDSAMAVFADLPELRRLYLHELASVGDSGLENLGALKSLELLDIWEMPQMTDATVDVIASLPNLKQLSIRTTGVTDAAIDKLLAMPNLESLTFKENGMVTAEALKKLASKKFRQLDIGPAASQ